MEGISYQTFNEWRKEKSEFSDAIKKAEVECKAGRIAVIFKAAEEKWQAAAWWLERRYPQEFAKIDRDTSQEPVQAVFSLPPSQFMQPENAGHPPASQKPRKSVKAALKK